MPPTGGSYVYGGTAYDAERGRLATIEAWADPLTFRQLEVVEVGAGWRCVDVGAGGGTVTRWLAERVGPAGSVVATDINPRFLVGLPANVEVRRHDISAEELEADTYDLVHCRLVLIHLSHPEVALRHMVKSLKPGGWLVVEDADWGLCTISGHPDGQWATEYLHRLSALHTERGLRYPYFGRTLPGLVAALPLDPLSGEASSPVCAQGDSTLEFHRMTVGQLRDPSLSLGASKKDFDRLLDVLADPSVVVLGVTLIGVRARRPLVV